MYNRFFSLFKNKTVNRNRLYNRGQLVCLFSSFSNWVKGNNTFKLFCSNSISHTMGPIMCWQTHAGWSQIIVLNDRSVHRICAIWWLFQKRRVSFYYFSSLANTMCYFSTLRQRRETVKVSSSVKQTDRSWLWDSFLNGKDHLR